MNKKAALSLGITTIVYLVIAMVIIGAAVSFVRTGFSTGTDALVQAVPTEDIGINPTRDNPIALSNANPEVKQGGSSSLSIGIYNTGGTEAKYGIKVGPCIDMEGTKVNEGTPKEISISSLPTNIGPGESIAFKTTLQADTSTAAKSPYICELISGTVDDTGAIPADNEEVKSSKS